MLFETVMVVVLQLSLGKAAIYWSGLEFLELWPASFASFQLQSGRSAMCFIR